MIELVNYNREMFPVFSPKVSLCQQKSMKKLKKDERNYKRCIFETKELGHISLKPLKLETEIYIHPKSLKMYEFNH